MAIYGKILFFVKGKFIDLGLNSLVVTASVGSAAAAATTPLSI
jgi:hypothetical protein